MKKLRIPLIAIGVASVLLVLGMVARRVSQRSIEERMAEGLRTILQADVSALLLWLDDRKRNASYFAEDPRVSAAVRRLGAMSRSGAAPVALRGSSQAGTLRTVLEPALHAFGYTHYYALDGSGRIIASSEDSVVGGNPSSEMQAFITRMLAGDTVVTLPVDLGGDQESGETTMIVGAPVHSSDLVEGVLAFGVPPERGFTDILRVRSGQSGETYALDSTGLMISNSRFDDELKRIGLLPDGARSALMIQIRDPGIDLTEEPAQELVSQRQFPLTRMAAEAVGRNYDPALPESETVGFDVDGYNDYRGVPVVGAWTWLPEYGFGVATEVDVAEAFRLQRIINRVLWSIFGLLLVSVLVLLGSSLWINRLNESVEDAKEVGQYKLEKKIGEGGMGKVYRARHALLRRPTAVKLLSAKKDDDVSLKRFEREVRHTSALSHPNTVAIYDYGRTPDGVFYYAMEYLPGVDLDKLVHVDGPMDQGRVVHVLKQACGALNEAHVSGLVHRDIKPSNIMLTERGGLFDFVKVLDFGLVRNVDQSATMHLTSDDMLVGTPLYMAPEAFKDPQGIAGGADIYSLAAVGYFMLAGDHAFAGSSIPEVVGKHLSGDIVPMAEQRGEGVDRRLETLLLGCFAKNPEERPTAIELHDELEALSAELPWTAMQARAWWEANASKRDRDDTWRIDFAASGPTPSRAPVSAALVVDLAKRGENMQSSKE